jgi:Ca2+-transporting ATPase
MNADSIDLKRISLSSSDVISLRAKFGENRLTEFESVSGSKILFNQFKSPLIYIILVAAGISLVLGEIGDFGIIIAVVVIDVVLGFSQEFQAQRTYLSLKVLLKPTARVIRDARQQEVSVWEIVPGDVVLIAAGDKVCADGQLLESIYLAVDEAILTGESSPVNKVAETGEDNEDQALLFMGSTVVIGRGIMKVTKIGSATELGIIASTLNVTKEPKTPLQIRLVAFSKSLSYLVVAATALILLAGVFKGRDFFDMLRTSIILAIAAVPEGLTIAVTVILVLGMRKILKRQGLVKRLIAVESLGSVTVICSDKTGTLTEGRMTVDRVDLSDEEQALRAMILCNNNQGPLEVALWEHAQINLKSDPQDIFESNTRIDEVLFSSETKFMITSVASSQNKSEVEYYVKGAPEIVLEMTNLDQSSKQNLLTQFDDWAKDGLRLLGLAYKTSGTLESEGDFTWLGMVGVADPVRDGVPEAIALAQTAGINIKMITGDYRHTAISIAKMVGISTSGEMLDGDEINKLTDLELRQKVSQISIFSRVRPHDKLRIVTALQANSEIVAMIGDGVNDAPALVRANIGVVVGSATDVAKESADLILLDNNFATIVSSIEEGRITFDNIRKVIAYVLSNSFAEVIAIFGAMLMGWPAPLTIAQILWIHLICDGPSDIVLGFEPREEGIMQKPPRAISEPLLSRLGLFLIAVVSISSGIFALFIFGYFSEILGDVARGQSVVYLSFAINSMVYIFAYRSMRTPLWRMTDVRRNKPLIAAVIAGLITAIMPLVFPPLGSLLGVVTLEISDWLVVSAFALILLVVVEVAKLIANASYKLN